MSAETYPPKRFIFPHISANHESARLHRDAQAISTLSSISFFGLSMGCRMALDDARSGTRNDYLHIAFVVGGIEIIDNFRQLTRLYRVCVTLGFVCGTLGTLGMGFQNHSIFVDFS